MMRSLLAAASGSGAKAKLTTLIFHRVLTRPDELLFDEMHAQRFDEICGWLAAWFKVLPLDEAAERLRRGDLPPRALCITFDDGYRDNHDVAMPILKRHGLPATFFIATGFLDGGRMWNDTVIETMRAAAAGRHVLAGIGGADLPTVELGDMRSRRQAADTIIQRVKYLAVAQRLVVTEALSQRLGVTPPDDLMMSSDQVRAMHLAGMQIGAHTVTHPILATLDAAAMRAEMAQSKARLEAIVGAPVKLFAYPNGKPERDYGRTAVALARELGFDAAVSTARGVADGRCDTYQLPRFTPWDQTRLRFGARLLGGLLRAVPPERMGLVAAPAG